MIYVATPYSHVETSVMEQRFEEACKITYTLLEQGFVVYSPIVHCHPIAVRFGLPRGIDFWEKFDRQMIMSAESILIVKMDGWEQSKGILQERKIAAEQDGMLFYFATPEEIYNGTWMMHPVGPDDKGSL